MIVVSNSSPLISLGAIGRLELLLKLYGAISIPRAVHDEVTVTGSGRPGAVEVQSGKKPHDDHKRFEPTD
jgi:uncharacterized protein